MSSNGGVTATLTATMPAGECVARVATTSPLELRGPFGGERTHLLINTTAGVFGCDRYDVTLRAEPGARFRISSPSAQKVYSMPAGQGESRLTIEAAGGSEIVYLPAQVILQAGADFRQAVRIDVGRGARVIFGEVVALGRLASGERLAFRNFSSELAIAREGGAPGYFERYSLTPGEDARLDDALAGFGVMGTLVAVGVSADIGGLRQVIGRANAWAGISRLRWEDAVVVKVLADRMDAASAVLDTAGRQLTYA